MRKMSEATSQMTDELHYWSATRVAEAIRRREITSRQYLEHLLDRVGRLDGPLNTIVTLDAERARNEADSADEAVERGEKLGPLHGVAMTIKDSFQTAGMRTTSGAPELADFIPEIDAVPVERLRSAGAVIFGKTNLPIYAGDTQSYNAVFGQTNNPWNPERTVGGSSGGAAGALAAGFTPLELGSDIGGSIRGPSSTCGVFGHKPSYGIVPALGQIPGPPGTLTQADLAVAGPMARSIEDLELALDVLAGPDDWHSPAYRLELPPPRKKRLRDYKVAFWLDEPSAPVDSEVRTRLLGMAEALRQAGVVVDEEARPAFGFDYAVEVFRALLGAALCGGDSLADIEAMAARASVGAASDRVEAGLGESAYRSQRHRQWLSQNERRLQMRRKWRDFFTEVDAVLMPTLPTAAIPHDHTEPMGQRTITVDGQSRPYLDQLAWVGLTGVAYLPATVIPAGQTAEGLPVGLQIAGPFLEDRTVLDLGKRLSQRVGGFEAPPGY